MRRPTNAIPPIRPNRAIEGISAVLLPFGADDRPDWDGYRRLLDRTWAAGLTPAVNMDTGYVNLISPAERAEALSAAADAGRGRRFVAGAFIEGGEGAPADLYLKAVDQIRAAGGTPILFQCSALGQASEREVLDVYTTVARTGGPLLAFELGTMFAPFGRIYSTAFLQALMQIEAFTGVKHSSLDRALEWERLALRDLERPEFRIYTGNDLAIDMVFYGSDYLLGLSAFTVEAFAARDRAWASGDSHALVLNDLLQYLGQFAFRAPVPAYKHSAAQFLHLRGVIATDRPHAQSPVRPASDVAVLADLSRRIDEALAAGRS